MSREPEERTRREAVSPAGQRPVRRARVLCVDDSPSARAQLLHLFESEYEVALASDGVEALLAARRQAPDVVVCDYDMPRLNGLQLLLAMKADPALRAIPFIVSTANAQQKVSAGMMAAGAHDLLPKSSGPEVLRARVGAALRSQGMHRPVETARPGAEP